jgi:dienelactone hydrolase
MDGPLPRARRGWLGLAAGLLAGLLTAAPSASQAPRARSAEDPASRHAGAVAAIKAAAEAVSAAPIPGSESREAWERARPRVRAQVASMLGLSPLPKRTPLQARITGTVARPGYRIEKLVFQSLPGLYVTGNLYVPESGTGRRPTILYVCGHSPHPAGAKWSYQDRGRWFVQHGYVCLVLDTLEFGEVPGLHHGLHDLNMWSWLSLGYTPAGVEIWNAIRALDYLETRPEVDMKRVGVTGISGGGAMSWYIPAMDDRVAVTAPICGTFTYGSQARHWRAFGQCDCIYYLNSHRLDLTAVGALIAPRPLLICSGRRDPDFPPDGYHAAYEGARKIYALYGQTAQVREVDADVGHTDAPLFLQEARQWMNRWLQGDRSPVPLAAEDATPLEEPATLQCLDRLPPDAINHRIHDQFIPTAPFRTPGSRQEWLRRREELLRGLREQVFGGFPRATVPFRSRRGAWDGAWAKRYADYEEWFFDSEAGVSLRAEVFRARSRGPHIRTLLYVKRAGDSLWPVDYDELLPVLGRRDVVVLYPRFTEQAITARERADLEMSSAWSGRTVGSQQVWDMLRAVEWLARDARLPTDGLSLYGKGDMGILGLYAGLLDERLQHVILSDPPVSHRQGPALLNVLRVTDIPEAAAAFAPRLLTVLGRLPEAFAPSRNVYRVLGRPSALDAAPSMPDAVGLFRESGRS